MPAEWCGEADHEAEDDARTGQYDEHDAVERHYTEHERAKCQRQAEEQPAEEPEDRMAANSVWLHPGSGSS